ncbi:SGNH/GDSL hydrolase family protein [Halosquirtibacter xylanolyticus]|uniref:SGNH/GDSL hydrolase family protein n=1 Tax=Halosquirtibacter xylanolyticus TaxID=3374599 RepID=UPI003748647C|nr:SGNH/GDSL hydrolase family protein [Prolixibacteraceae bacterium]
MMYFTKTVKMWLCTTLFFISTFITVASTPTEKLNIKDQSQWKGHKKIQLELIVPVSISEQPIQGHIVIPNTPLPGNPWVWRARFPNWHTEMDSILLEKGYHIAFINTNGMLGSPRAMKIWDNFYKHITTNYHLSAKTSLEAVSRGGLFVYNWAKNNVDKVNSIYAEAPVCDFKSWPLGQGKGKGHKETWEKLKKEYGFKNDTEALAYKDIPLNGIEELASAKIPILHMIGLNDRVVPPTENTFLLVDKYIKHGGPATIIPCTKGKQDLWGHHFPIETPQIGADFIIYHTPKIKKNLNANNYHQQRGGIKNSLIKFTRNKKARVAFLGGSITYNHGWRDSICQYLEIRFPQTQFEFIKAGIPSMGSTPASFRIERDIPNLENIDLLFEEAAVNDASNGRTNIEQKRAMEGIVRHLRKKNPEMDIVLMHFVDPNKIETYNNGNTPEVILNHEAVAKHYNIPSLNLALEVTERINHKEFTWEKDFKNLHPSPFGQGIYAHSMLEFLDQAWSSGVAEDDKITTHLLPKAMDTYSYEGGKLNTTALKRIPKGWKREESWVPKDGKRTRDNYHHVPMLISETPNAILKYKFKGKAIGITIAAGPDAGVLEYAVDNKNWKKVDLFTRWSSHIHLPWYLVLEPELENTNHTLYLRVSKEKNEASKGHACRIRYFITNQ